MKVNVLSVAGGTHLPRGMNTTACLEIPKRRSHVEDRGLGEVIKLK
jgi:hypothetical protein